MLSIYRFLTIIFFPLFVLVIFYRRILKKENNLSLKQKIFTSKKIGFFKDEENLIWFHGASIGEITSAIPIINYFINNNFKIILTTTTLSSAKIINKIFENNKNITHHFLPLDVPHLTKKFIKKWNLKLVCFIDSEIWPNFIFEIKKNKIPLALINARITKKTFKKWNKFPNFAKKIFSFFDICISCSNESYKNLEAFNVKNIKNIGNLKFIDNISTNLDLDEKVKNVFDNHKTWFAASTHEEEEIFCLIIHKHLKKIHQNILTIIAPRHIKRVNNIFSECLNLKLKAQIFNEGDEVREDAEILIINSFGQLPKYFNYCKSVFMGKSLPRRFISTGGQNPIEAAKLSCKIYHGPYIYNFKEVYNYLNKINISEEVSSLEELTLKLLEDFKKPKKIDKNILNEISNYSKMIFNGYTKELSKLIK